MEQNDNKYFALSVCLSQYLRTTSLHALYYTCKSFFYQRPRYDLVEKKVVVYPIEICFTKTFMRHLSCKHDGFYVDAIRNIYYVVYNKRCYQIPLLWIKKLYRLNNVWYLHESDFCCRLNITVNTDNIRFFLFQDICLDGIIIEHEMFHVGIGHCNSRNIQRFVRKCKLPFGWHKIYQYLYSRYCTYTKRQLFTALSLLNDDDVGILIHVIFCKYCCRYFNEFMTKYVMSIYEHLVDSNGGEPVLNVFVEEDALAIYCNVSFYCTSVICERVKRIVDE